MPFKVAHSPFYKVEITLPGYGKTLRLSTKSTRIRTARKMEEALRFVWEDGYHELIEALEPRGPGPTARLNWIYEPAHIDACTRQMIRNEGYKPDTVKNSLWGFIAKLLRKKLGPTKAREILEWADRPPRTIGGTWC